ncbi:MAG TPA: NosD domain-containing protein [Gemmatimonadales bacterium]|nr:NosD domain-containing protein [Gemmatimonadales bacterium]
MTPTVVPLALLLASAAPAAWPGDRLPTLAPCVRLDRAGTEVRNDMRVCPGRYRIPASKGRAVLEVAVSGVRLDLSGVVIESGDSVPERFSGAGVVSRGVDSLVVTGGTIRGYRFGVLIEGGRGHEVRGANLSFSRHQALQSSDSAYSERDWLDIFHADSAESYGAGLLLKRVTGAIVVDVTAQRAQNGIMLHEVREAQLSDNDVSRNSGWGIALWRSSHNVIVRNKASHNVRCVGRTYRRGCDSAALLLRHRSDSNVVVANDLRYSGDGFFLSGHRPGLDPSSGNLVTRNDATGAYHNAFEATFSWDNSFIENRADSADYGFWLGYSSGSSVRGNTILGSRTAGIAIEHGSDNELSGNVIIGGKDGIRLFTSSGSDAESRGYRIYDNLFAKLRRGLVLENTSQLKVRGNVFDGNDDGLVSDKAASGAEVVGNIFLRSSGFFIRADELDAGGNYWGTATPEATREKLAGRVLIAPWYSASAAGY